MSLVFSHIECARLLSHELLSGNVRLDQNPLLAGLFAAEWEALKAKCQLQLNNSSSVVLKLADFPDCPIFNGRAPANNGYVQLKKALGILTGNTSAYMHRIAAQFHCYEAGMTEEQIRAMDEDEWEASHLFCTLPYHSRRNFNPKHVILEQAVYNKSRHFCT